jgi:hypothetical protein
MTDQPNVEPPGAELGITLEQARANIGRQVEYVAGDLPDRVAFIERGRLTGIPPSEDGANAFVTFDNAEGAKATPLERLRLLERPRSLAELADQLDEIEARHPAPAPEPTLSGLAAALHNAAEDPHNDHCGEYEGLTEGDAEFLAQVARVWMDSQVKPAPPTGTPWAPMQPAMPYPMQWGDQPPPWGQPPAVPAEVPDLIEQREWLPVVTPHVAGERVIYRGRPMDPALLAIVVSVQQNPSGVVAVCQYTVRVPYLGQTLGAYADQLAPWYAPEPDF